VGVFTSNGRLKPNPLGPESNVAIPRLRYAPNQATLINSRETEIEKLIENIKNRYSSSQEQRRQLDLLADLNKQYQRPREEDTLLESRTQDPGSIQRFRHSIPLHCVSPEPVDMLRLVGTQACLSGRDMQPCRKLTKLVAAASLLRCSHCLEPPLPSSIATLAYPLLNLQVE
jgi:hypothetical protein